MSAEETLKYIAGCGDGRELRAISKAAYDRLRDIERIGDPSILAKLRLAKPMSVLKVAWRGNDDLVEVEFQALNRGTVTGTVRHLFKSYRFPIGWVKEVLPPDGKKSDPLRTPARRRRRRLAGDGEDFD